MIIVRGFRIFGSACVAIYLAMRVDPLKFQTKQIIIRKAHSGAASRFPVRVGWGQAPAASCASRSSFAYSAASLVETK